MSPKSNSVLGANRGPLLTTGSGSQDDKRTEAIGTLFLTTPTTRKEKWHRHWKRFWLFYCIGNVIFLAIFLPIVFLVILPAVAQLVLNKSDLWLINAVVSQPRPNSVMMTPQTKLDLKLALPVRIDPAVLQLYEPKYGAAVPYADVQLAGQIIKGNYTLGVSEQFTPLLNQTAWEKFVHQVTFQEETGFWMQGSMNAYLGVLKSHVHMNKQVVAPTLNQFNGFSISDATLLLPAQTDGTNFIGNTILPNPTVTTLEVGTLHLDIKSGNLTIGNASLNDVTLVPGDNTFPLQGILDLKTVLKKLGYVLQTQASALKHGNLSVDAVTTSVVWNGTEVPYYTDILRTLTLSTSLRIADVLKNTFAHLKAKKNGTGGLSSILGHLNKSTLASRSVEDDSPKPADLPAFMRHNPLVQHLFEGMEPGDRDTLMQSIAEVCPALLIIECWESIPWDDFTNLDEFSI